MDDSKEFEPYTNIVPIDGKKTVDLETGEVGYGKNLLDSKPGGAFSITVDIIDKGDGVEEVVGNKTLHLMNFL